MVCPCRKPAKAMSNHLPQVFGAWERDEIADVPERYADFTARLDGLIEEISANRTAAPCWSPRAESSPPFCAG